MPDEPLHPSFATADEARESFLTEASAAIESARTARLNPVADKLPPVPPESKSVEPVPPPPAQTSTKAPEAVRIPGPPPSPEGPSGKEPGEASPPPSDLADGEQEPDVFKDIPGPTDPPKGKGAAENWSKLHSRAEYWRRRATEVRQAAKLEKPADPAKPDPAITKQLETLQSERDNLLARLEAVAVEKSPRFEAAFRPREEAAVAQAKSAVGPERAKRIEELLSLPESTYRDEQVDALLNDLGTGVRGAKLAQAVADLDRIRAERQALASRGSDLYKQWQSEEQAAYQRQQKEREDRATQIFTSELATWREAGYLKDEQEAALAKSVFSGQADYADAARASIWAVVGPQLAGQAMSAKKRIGELEAELAKLRAVQPSPTGGSDAKIEADDSIVPADLSYSDAIARMVQQGGFLR